MNGKMLLVFILVISCFAGCDYSKAQSENSKIENTTQNTDSKIETDEEKAMRFAEEFIKRNGYTDAPADKNNLSHETVEFAANVDELLKERYNSLEPKAFGVSHHGRLRDNKGWTVVFTYKNDYLGEDYLKQFEGREIKTGRAVTMNENFENLLVEHKDFILEKVEKKLQ